MWQKLRTGILVTLVTVLIWIWAEAETQRDDLLSPAGAGGAESELVIDRLPVFVAVAARGGGPAQGAGQWPVVEGPDMIAGESLLQRVRVRGPRSVIDRLRAGEAGVSPFALVVLRPDDAEGGSVGGRVTAAITIGPPELGLRPVEPAPLVTVSVKR